MSGSCRNGNCKDQSLKMLIQNEIIRNSVKNVIRYLSFFARLLIHRMWHSQQWILSGVVGLRRTKEVNWSRSHMLVIIIYHFLKKWEFSVAAKLVTIVNTVNRSFLTAFPGTTIGNILTLSLSGFMCESEVDGGWPLLFYVFGEWLVCRTTLFDWGVCNLSAKK